MRARSEHTLCAPLLESLRPLTERTCRVDDVVDEQRCLSLDLPDEVHDLCAAGARTTLLNNRNRRVQEVRHDTRARNTAEIRRDHDEILNVLKFMGAK